MKQILITQEIKVLAKEYADNLFIDKKGKFVQPVAGLKNLILDLKEINGGLEDLDKYVNYVEEIIKDYPNLKDLLPSKVKEYKDKYDGILKETKLSVVIKHRKRDLPKEKKARKDLPEYSAAFYDEIVCRMHYKDVRPYLGKYMKQMGMNTCVYCNNTKAAFSEDRQEVYYPFDHSKPKDKYPFLCINFFNLYPCCTNCNGHKLNDVDKAFQIYVEAGQLSDPFVFTIERNKLINGDPESIVVDFSSRLNKDKDLAEDYNDSFRITDLYNTEDEKRNSYKMLKEIDKYRASYPDATEASLPLTVDRKQLFQEILGVDDNEDNIFTDVNKKLKLDTAKDAHLI
jgi:5-methylcytosine-specific restriction endonuclease McrA